MTFDEILDHNERVTSMTDHRKAVGKSKTRKLKQQQMKASIRSIENKLKSAEDAYIASMFTYADTVSLSIEVEKYKEELRVARDMYEQLFYGRIKRTLIKLYRWISRK